MEFAFSEEQQSYRRRARALAGSLPTTASAAAIVAGAAREGLLRGGLADKSDAAGADFDVIGVAIAVEELSHTSATAGFVLALHTGVMLALAPHPTYADRLVDGTLAGAVALSSDVLPVLSPAPDARLSGRASWVGPLTEGGVAIVGARTETETVACFLPLDGAGVESTVLDIAALDGFACGHLSFAGAAVLVLGSPVPLMARVRVLLAAAGLGIGRRALEEALAAARAYVRTGAGGEQTVQGLLADAATELEAARVLVWKAAAAEAVSLADASMAKLIATEAAQRAVSRATQVLGADTFKAGHIIERLAQDVRALELFAGRTEALRDAIAEATLPR